METKKYSEFWLDVKFFDVYFILLFIHQLNKHVWFMISSFFYLIQIKKQ